jgi:hypothetical protein
MPDNQSADVILLLDCSEAMQPIKTGIESGFDAFVAEQRALPGTCTVSLAQFDHRYWRVWAGVDISAVPALNLLPTRGGTALLDAIWHLFRDTGDRLGKMSEQRRPGVGIVGIVSASLENESREMTWDQVRMVVDRQQLGLRYAFAYLGANQDAIEVASKIGVSADRAMTFTAAGAAEMMRGFSALVTRTRLAMAAGTNFYEVLASTAFTAEERAAAGHEPSGPH